MTTHDVTDGAVNTTSNPDTQEDYSRISSRLSAEARASSCISETLSPVPCLFTEVESYLSAPVGDLPSGWNTLPHTCIAPCDGLRVGTARGAVAGDDGADV